MFVGLWSGTSLRKCHVPLGESNGASLVWNRSSVKMETAQTKYGSGQEQIRLSTGLHVFTAGLSLLQWFVFSL